MLLTLNIILIHILVTRDNLHAELTNLMDEQRNMDTDISGIQSRLQNARADKMNVKRLEEELERLTEEMTQVDLDEKVI
jgi:DNA repair protein RAD50